MQDVRNAENYNMRLGSAKKGRNVAENTSIWLTWYTWGHDNGNLTEKELIAAYAVEFQEVLHFNMENHSRAEPWKRLENGRYVLKGVTE